MPAGVATVVALVRRAVVVDAGATVSSRRRAWARVSDDCAGREMFGYCSVIVAWKRIGTPLLS